MLKVQCDRGECEKWRTHYDAVLGFIIQPARDQPKPARFYEVNFKNDGSKCYVKKKIPSEAETAFLMADSDFVEMMRGNLSPETAFKQEILVIKGDAKIAGKFNMKMFPQPTPENRALLLGQKVKLQSKL